MLRLMSLSITLFAILGLGGVANASLFNFTEASGWRQGWGPTPSVQASRNLQLLLQNQNSSNLLGAILLNSVSNNQSYAVAEAVRFALLPDSSGGPKDTSRTPGYDTLAANIGAATAYAMHYAAQQEFGGLPGSPQPPSTGGTILQSDHDASILVKPNASDIFFAVAAGAVGAVSSSCDGNWRCHTSDCNTPLAVMNKRVYICCGVVAPLMRGVDRRASVIPLVSQLALLGESTLLGDALSPAAMAEDLYNLAFLERCLWFPYDARIKQAPANCNANSSANYMGKVVRIDINSHTPGAN
ncbi:hypothetical protein COCSUDRAFT_64791 [Coccomyxa subellipsoidea C-169]|uniref:Uncharacterized protein n=1 Tax=Coccomyxa subellipsoidea (strain C-169) TaxID=574566 RepID=I0Z4Y9_COCSC|nr:hypothetical protein COCSUDRAFT_64791 [Coccomyxa subellipsoidea C-169]EIE25708.1 hypothetical protein COCSUDRAFT_64791 [Coccomyxa subellipsoidea C-169]|eukprot:XP_005650252.1 hypothetical protein COCSUDRAFT_64791 [Coccomyxa subellipsoidea C-169]